MKSRSQQFLDAITANDVSLLPNPVTREERFLHALCTGELITPTTFEEQFLQAALAFKGVDSGGGNPNLFTGIYESGYFLDTINTTDILNYSGETTVMTVVPVSSGNYYKVVKSSLSNRFASMFTNRAPSLSGSTEEDLGFPATLHAPSTLEVTLYAPAGATHLIIYVSNVGEEPDLTISKL